MSGRGTTSRWLSHAAFAVVVVALIVFAVVAKGRQEDAETAPPAVTPPPARVVDASRLPPAESPQGTVFRFWRFIQIGSFPTALFLYHPRVRAEIGIDNLIGALSLQRPALLSAQPEIASLERTKVGTLVTVRPEESRSTSVYTFLLRRGGAGWRILYDTVVADALASYVQQQDQTRSGNAEPSPAALAAGQRLTNRFRGLFVEG